MRWLKDDWTEIKLRSAGTIYGTSFPRVFQDGERLPVVYLCSSVVFFNIDRRKISTLEKRKNCETVYTSK